MMNVKMPTATDDDDDRIDHRAFDLALERFGSFLEVGQALQNDFQRTAGLAGLDHVHVQAVEALWGFWPSLARAWSRLRCRRTTSIEAVLEPAGLRLAFEDPQAAQNRQAGVLQDRKLPGERA